MSVAADPFWALAIAVVLPAMLIFLFSGCLTPLGQTVDNNNPLQWISPGRWFAQLLTGWNYIEYPNNFYGLPMFKNSTGCGTTLSQLSSFGVSSNGLFDFAGLLGGASTAEGICWQPDFQNKDQVQKTSVRNSLILFFLGVICRLFLLLLLWAVKHDIVLIKVVTDWLAHVFCLDKLKAAIAEHSKRTREARERKREKSKAADMKELEAEHKRESVRVADSRETSDAVADAIQSVHFLESDSGQASEGLRPPAEQIPQRASVVVAQTLQVPPVPSRRRPA